MAEARVFKVKYTYICPSDKPFCGLLSLERITRISEQMTLYLNYAYSDTQFSFRTEVVLDVNDQWSHFGQVDYLSLFDMPGTEAEFWEKYADDQSVINIVRPYYGNYPAWSGSTKPGAYFPLREARLSQVGDIRTTYLMAHELGHFFSLAHTFKRRDEHLIQSWANFDADGLSSTPPTPGRSESGTASHDAPDFEDPLPLNVGNHEALRNGHAYCVEAVEEPTYAGGEILYYSAPEIWWDSIGSRINAGSAQWLDYRSSARWGHTPASPRCYWNVDGEMKVFGWSRSYLGGDEIDLSDVTHLDQVAEPMWSNMMSYFMGMTKPPFELRGRTHSGFTYEQKAKMLAQLSAGGNREGLVDQCADLGGDTDHDGLCDQGDDPCPTVGTPWRDASYWDDEDEDGIVAACDQCDRDPLNPPDLDNDGLVGACDPDEDNDGCPDEPQGGIQIDRDPTSAGMYSHTIVCINSEGYVGEYDVHGFTGLDQDGDGLLTCELGEVDADGDGIVNWKDPCPLFEGDVCRFPSICDAFWEFGCFGNCDDYYFTITDPSYPVWSPPEFDVLASFGRQLILRPGTQQTAGQNLRMILEALEPGKDRGNQLVIQVHDEKGAVLGRAEIQRDNISGSYGVGNLIVLQLPESKEQTTMLMVSPVMGRGIDFDGDSVPDAADNCVLVSNANQGDFDLDGHGDACDVDLDQDGVVSLSEVAFVKGCVGHVVLPTVPGEVSSRDCDVADLDGDGKVDYMLDYVELAFPQEGKPPGPSGLSDGSW